MTDKLKKKSTSALAERRMAMSVFFNNNIKHIENACAKHLTPERMIRIALTAASRNPKLYECTPASFLGALIDCSQLGLEPIPSLGHAYLVPYQNNKTGKREVQLQVGYKGLIALALRSNKIQSFKTGTIHANDKIKLIEGINDIFELTYSLAEERGKIIGSYAIATINSQSTPSWKVIPLSDIYKARDRSKDYKYWLRDGKPDNRKPIWVEHFDSMAMKTAIRRLSPVLPMCPEFQAAAQVDELREIGVRASFGDIFGVPADGGGDYIDIESEVIDDNSISNAEESNGSTHDSN